MAIDKEKWVSVSELANYLGFCKDTIYTWLAERDMPALRAGKLWKFKISQVEQWLADGGAHEGKLSKKPEQKNESSHVTGSGFCHSKKVDP